MKLRASFRLPFLATMLGFSGASALVYQTAWLREFRLVFGGATAATSAVLAIFMGGLGAGSALFGRRAEAAAEPLRLYGFLELGVGASALLTPVLLAGVRAIYAASGGTAGLGLTTATLIQLLLSAVVLSVPCLLMGGSLPAAVKWAETDEDRQRGTLGVLYGVNALGAVLGVLAGTFWLLEHWGTRATVAGAAAVNLAIGAAACLVARRAGAGAAPATVAAKGAPAPSRRATATRVPACLVQPKAPPLFVYLAAGVSGFVFFVSELVWFRMLAPLLGSTVYGFGLILAVALAGIGLGGLLYRRGWASQAGAVSLGALALVSAWQALLLAAPWALGDRVAVLALFLNELRAFGLLGQILAWALVTSLLVFGPSLLAGVQFPLLVGLLGEGARDSGRHVGYAYAANTLGSIAGALLGGFVLVPRLTAPGCWRLVVMLTLVFSASAAFLAGRSARRRVWVSGAALWAATTWMLSVSVGPTAAWRHTPIGYGRVESVPHSVNGLREWLNAGRLFSLAEFEGREVSASIVASDDGYAFLVNGKSDGSAFGDSSTQVMLGLLPAMLHPAPRSALVVGLGTGSSAGWLADVPDMARVDVVELEAGMQRFARDFFAPVNRDVMNKANVHVRIGDAREVLQTAGPRYDLIVSEPSNPYRAGVAALFTQEFYAAVKGRLSDGGLFAQWVQSYEIDAAAVRLVYATLASVFPYVETWVTKPSDLLFVCHLAPPAYSLDQLRARVQEPPFAEAIHRVWFTASAEGVLAHHFAAPELAPRLAAGVAPNTDDRNRLEYGMVRALVRDSSFDSSQVLALASAQHLDVPSRMAGQIDRARLQQARMLLMVANQYDFTLPDGLAGDDLLRAQATQAYGKKRYAETLRLWTGEPLAPMAQLMLVDAAAKAGTPEQLRPRLAPILQEWPAEARFAAAISTAQHGTPDATAEHLRAGFTALRTQVWARLEVVQAALSLTQQLVAAQPERAAAFFELLRAPFPAGLGETSRLSALASIGPRLPPALQVQVADTFDASPPWTRSFLEFRARAYRGLGDRREARAQRDLADFLANADPALQELLAPAP